MMAVRRRVGLGLAVLGAAALASSGVAVAQGRPTITAAPNPTTSGDPMVIFGRAPAGAKVVLWHRINPAPRFTPIQRTTASPQGTYEFPRADGVVTTNRDWFVVGALTPGVNSVTITGLTADQPVVFRILAGGATPPDGGSATLAMPAAEQRTRIRLMRGLIQEFNVYRWAGRMLIDAAGMRRRGRLLDRAATPERLSRRAAGREASRTK